MGRVLALLVIALGSACHLVFVEEPPEVDATGDYSITITNRENGCAFADWVEGTSTKDIHVILVQSDSEVTATITEGPGFVWGFLFGSNMLRGTAERDTIALALTGTSPFTMMTCTYTYNGEIIGRLTGDALVGRINVRAATNGSPDCGVLDGCLTYQDFNGTRPP